MLHGSHCSDSCSRGCTVCSNHGPFHLVVHATKVNRVFCCFSGCLRTWVQERITKNVRKLFVKNRFQRYYLYDSIQLYKNLQESNGKPAETRVFNVGSSKGSMGKRYNFILYKTIGFHLYKQVTIYHLAFVTWTARRTESANGGRGILRLPPSHSPDLVTLFRNVYIPYPCLRPSCHDPS